MIDYVPRHKMDDLANAAGMAAFWDTWYSKYGSDLDTYKPRHAPTMSGVRDPKAYLLGHPRVGWAQEFRVQVLYPGRQFWQDYYKKAKYDTLYVAKAMVRQHYDYYATSTLDAPPARIIRRTVSEWEEVERTTLDTL